MTDPNLPKQLRIKIDQYLRGDLDRAEFRAWFAPALWSADALDQELARLVYDLELAFAELDANNWTEAQFEDELRHIAHRSTKVTLT